MLNNNRFLEKITSRIYLAIIAFLLIIICINKPVFIVPGIILFILIIIYSYWTNSKRNAELSRQIQNLTMTMDGTAKKSLINSPFPLIIIETTGKCFLKAFKPVPDGIAAVIATTFLFSLANSTRLSANISV